MLQRRCGWEDTPLGGSFQRAVIRSTAFRRIKLFVYSRTNIENPLILHFLAFFAVVPGSRNRELITLLPRLSVAASAQGGTLIPRVTFTSGCGRTFAVSLEAANGDLTTSGGQPSGTDPLRVIIFSMRESSCPACRKRAIGWVSRSWVVNPVSVETGRHDPHFGSPFSGLPSFRFGWGT
jgi:hypothetical protein